MKKLLYYVPTILFNTLELFLLFMIGTAMDVEIYKMISILLTFTLVRNLIGEGKHYKNPALCLIWSLAVFSILFLICKLNFILALILTIFYSAAQTGKVDVTDMFMYRVANTNYEYIQEFVNNMAGTKTLEDFETKLMCTNPKAYAVYKYRFKEGYVLDDISDTLGIDKRRVTEILQALELAINLYFNIKS